MRNGAPFSKPRVRLYGETGDAQNYLGAAYNLLHKVRQYCENTGAPVFGMQRSLPDGAVVKAAILGNEEIVSCFPPTRTVGGREERKETRRKLLTLDCGWLQDSGSDPITESPPGRYNLYISPDCLGTLEVLNKAAKGVFKDFVETAEECASFGENLTYDHYEDAAEREEAQERDAALIQAKRMALPVLGTCTGLARQWLRGLFGRPLRKTPNITIEPTTRLVSVEGFFFIPGTFGVVGLEGRFFTVSLNGGLATLTELIPDISTRVVYVDEFQAVEQVRPRNKSLLDEYLEATGVVKLAYATLLLSYARKGDTFQVALPQGVIVPTFGWNFSYFSAKCVGVRWEVLPLASGGGLKTVTQELRFSLREDDVFEIGVFSSKEEFYSNTGAAVIWVPVPSLGELHRLVLPPRPATSNTTLHAYYGIDDELVEVKAGNEGSVSYPVTTQVKALSDIACGAGTSTVNNRWESGTSYSREVSAGDLVISTDYYTLYDEVWEEYRIPSLTNGNTWAINDLPGACSTQILGPAPPGVYSNDSDPMYGTHTRYVFGEYSVYQANQLAVIIPFFNTDSCFLLETELKSGSTNEWELVKTYQINGIRSRNNNDGNKIWKIAYYPLGAVGGSFSGAALPTPEEYYTIPPTSSYLYELGCEAAACFSDKQEASAVVNDSLWAFTHAEATVFYFLPYIVHSIHGEAWGMIRPEIGNTVYAGPSGINNGIPIGVQ